MRRHYVWPTFLCVVGNDFFVCHLIAEPPSGDESGDRSTSKHLHLHQGPCRAAVIRDCRRPAPGHCPAINCCGCVERSFAWMGWQLERTNRYRMIDFHFKCLKEVGYFWIWPHIKAASGNNYAKLSLNLLLTLGNRKLGAFVNRMFWRVSSNHSKTGPFTNCPYFDYLKTGHVWFSDPHCTKLFQMFNCMYTDLLVWLAQMSCTRGAVKSDP